MSWGMVGAAAITAVGSYAASQSGDSGSSSSGSSGSSNTVATPDPVELQTTGYGGMGRTEVPNTFTAEAKPSWMTGHFDAPWWGTDAVTGEALTQADYAMPVEQQSYVMPTTTEDSSGNGTYNYKNDLAQATFNAMNNSWSDEGGGTNWNEGLFQGTPDYEAEQTAYNSSWNPYGYR